MTPSPPRHIGLLVGREWSWPPAFIDEVNRRDIGVIAGYVKLGAPTLDEAIPWDVVIDRISHEVPFYRIWLKHAMVRGVRVINNPFMWSADDKFFGGTLAEAAGVRSPRTVALPNKAYIPGIKHDESLRNLDYPLDWDGVIRHVGLPCVLKDAHGGGWKDVWVCRSRDELIQHYDESGLLAMIVQEYIEWDEFVRCLCIGRQHILPIQYDPRERRYIPGDTFLPVDLRARIISGARTLVRALGYDMNSIEFAIRDGVPYAIDFMNPAPDFDVNSLKAEYFEWAVRTMADVAIEMALEPRKAPVAGVPTLFGPTPAS